MKVTEAAKILGRSESMVREYARASGLQRVHGAYDITQDMVTEWMSSPPSTRGASAGRRPRKKPELDGPKILESLRGLETPGERARRLLARKRRKDRLMAAIRSCNERSV